MYTVLYSVQCTASITISVQLNNLLRHFCTWWTMNDWRRQGPGPRLKCGVHDRLINTRPDISLGEVAKKGSFFKWTVHEEGGGKRLSTKEKKNFLCCCFLFFFVLFFCSRWKIKYILFKTIYPNINISCRLKNLQSLTGYVKHLPKNMALLTQFFSSKLERKKNCQNLFPAILRRKKILFSTKPEGG